MSHNDIMLIIINLLQIVNTSATLCKNIFIQDMISLITINTDDTNAG